jgi:hypothetical protein
MRRVSGVCVVAVFVVLAVLGSVAGASAGPVFTSASVGNPVAPMGVTYPIAVSGSFVPLPMACGVEKRVLWYAPGVAPDGLWRNITFPVSGAPSYTASALTITGVYSPFTGDFNGDGCEDVFWYAPGAAADFVWYFNADATFTALPVTVNGTYTPIVGSFNNDSFDDIFWYGPGAVRESIMAGSATKGVFTASTAPQVVGTYTPVLAFDAKSILWFQSGIGPDFVWRNIQTNTTVQAVTSPTTVNGTYFARNLGGTPLLYAPGAAPDQAITGVTDSVGTNPVVLKGIAGAINGTYTVSNSTTRAGFGVLHAPGAAADYLINATAR